MKAANPTILLDLAGALLSANWLWLAKMSHAQEAVNVWRFLGIMTVAWTGTLWAWRFAKDINAKQLLIRLWFWAVIFRFVGLVGQPILETDFYRYLWDGRQFALTGNPYASPPAAHFDDASLPSAFTQILDGINYPHVPTIYGPISETSFLVSYWVAPGQVWPLKLILIAADLLTLWLLLRMAKPSNALLYAWCPLLIKETAFTAHSDSLGIVLLVWALYAWHRGHGVRLAVASALAVGAKVFAALLVPFLLWRTRKSNWLIFIAVLAALYLPFWLQGSVADLAGLSAFMKHWEFNSSIYAVLSWMSGPANAKLICGLLFLTAWSFYFFRWRSNTVGTFPRGELIFGLFFLLSATVNPWYLLWLLPFAVPFPSVAAVTALATVSLSYISGLNLGNADQVGLHLAWVRPVEYGAIFAALLVDWLRWQAKRAPATQQSSAESSIVRIESRFFLETTAVLIPALNEEQCVAQTIAYWKQLGARVVRVIDNGSTDATAQLARQAEADVVSEPKRGYGAAAWRGLQNLPSEIEWILFSSADGSDRLAPHELQEWRQRADAGLDMILGDRFEPLASRKNLRAAQTFGNLLCCWLIALGWGRRFNDMGSLRLVRRDALQRLDLHDRGFGWNVEMQVRAIERNLRIVEMPVGYLPRRAGKSKISGNLRGSIRAGWGILSMVAQLWLTRTHQPQVVGVCTRLNPVR